MDDGVTPADRDVLEKLRQFSAALPAALQADYLALVERLERQRAGRGAAGQAIYQSLFNNNHSVMLLIDPKTGAIVDANPAAAAFYGYTREALRKMRITDINTLPAAEVQAEMERARLGQRKFFNFIHRLANQELREVEVISGPVAINNRQLLYSLVYDVTDSRRTLGALKASEERYRLLFEEAIEGIVLTSAQGEILTANTAFARMLGYSSLEDLTTNVKDIAVQVYANREDRQRLVSILSVEDRVENFEVQLVRKDGSKIWASFNINAIRDREGKMERLDSRVVDITVRREAEQQVIQANERLFKTVVELEKRNRQANLMRQMVDILVVCNGLDEAFIAIQQYCAQLFPSTSGAVFLADRASRTVETAAVWGANLQSERLFSMDECWALRRGQFHRWALSTPGMTCRHMLRSYAGEYLCAPLMLGDELAGVLHIELAGPVEQDQGLDELAQIVVERMGLALSNIQLREKLRAQSIRDPLTGLFNRRYMEESLNREILKAMRSKRSLGVIMLDIDHFKNYNDVYGHEGGDVVLKELGALLLGQIRGGDIACRYGGEEFILIIPEVERDTVIRRATSVLNKVRGMRVETRNLNLGKITVSLGVAMMPEDGATPEEILRNADEALYMAKRNGRNRLEVYDRAGEEAPGALPDEV